MSILGRWLEMTHLNYSVRKHDRLISLGVAPVATGYLVALIETPEAAAASGAEAVFADHAHAVVGTFPTVREAKTAAMRTLRDRITTLDRCACKNIPKAKKRRAA